MSYSLRFPGGRGGRFFGRGGCGRPRGGGWRNQDDDAGQVAIGVACGGANPAFGTELFPEHEIPQVILAAAQDIDRIPGRDGGDVLVNQSRALAAESVRVEREDRCSQSRRRGSCAASEVPAEFHVVYRVDG